MKHVLVIGGTPTDRRTLGAALDRAYDISAADDLTAATRALEQTRFDLLIFDASLGQGAEVSFLPEVWRRYPALPAIVITASPGVSHIVEAMKTGASDFMTRPLVPGELRSLADRAVKRSALHRNATSLQEQMARAFPVDRIVGQAPVFTAVLGDALLASQHDDPVLLVGEHGTGRELLARLIHSAGTRGAEPFVPVHCAILPAAEMDVELFGAEAAGEAARQGQFDVVGSGTLYLHESDQLDRSTQIRLHQVLAHGEFRRGRASTPIRTVARIIAASRISFEELAARPTFRADLLQKLGTTVLRVPPLRERREDIPALARHYLQRFRRSTAAAAEDYDRDAMDLLVRYAWPGNIRELRNVIERILVLHRTSPIVRSAHLPREFHARGPGGADEGRGRTLAQAVNEFERNLVERALMDAGGVQTRAAELLGTTRRVLKYRMEKLNISVP